MGCLPRHLYCVKKPKLNHVMSCGDCTSDKLNCNSHSVCSGGKWLLTLYRLEFWEVCFVFFCRVFLKQEKSIIYVSSYRGRVSCAVYVGYVKAGILPVQQDRDYLLFVAWKLVFVCHLGGSVKTQEETNGGQEDMCSPWKLNLKSSCILVQSHTSAAISNL